MAVDNTHAGAVLTLTADGVSVVLDATDGRLPAIVHWGAALPPMDAEQTAALLMAAVPVIGSNNPDVTPRLAMLPEHHTGWTGRPGLCGSRRGRHWSPVFGVTSLLLDGAPGSGDRVVLLGRRPDRPGGPGADRPGVGVGQHRPARPSTHVALDRPAAAP